MNPKNPSMKDADANRRKRLALCADVLTKWFTKWSEVFPTHEVTKIQMATYVEALDDLSVELIEAGCREATRTAEQFPKPGHIRKAIEKIQAAQTVNDRVFLLGPPAEKYPEITQEERDAAIEYGEELKKQLAKEEKIKRSAQEQIDELRKAGWLQ
jgi:hypothetical protein